MANDRAQIKANVNSNLGPSSPLLIKGPHKTLLDQFADWFLNLESDVDLLGLLAHDENRAYQQNQGVFKDGKLWKSKTALSIGTAWDPNNFDQITGSVALSDYGIPEWESDFPGGAGTGYSEDAQVTRDDRLWSSDSDANTQDPLVGGWTELSANDGTFGNVWSAGLYKQNQVITNPNDNKLYYISAASNFNSVDISAEIISGDIVLFHDTFIVSAVDNKLKCDTSTAGIGNITLSGEQTLNGVLTASSRVIVVEQTAGEENGIYITGAGAWVRATDSDSSEKVSNGLLTKVSNSNSTKNRYEYLLITADPIVLDTTPLVFDETPGVGFGTTAGTATEGNDSRLVNTANRISEYNASGTLSPSNVVKAGNVYRYPDDIELVGRLRIEDQGFGVNMDLGYDPGTEDAFFDAGATTLEVRQTIWKFIKKVITQEWYELISGVYNVAIKTDAATANHVHTLPAKSGTIAHTSDIPSVIDIKSGKEAFGNFSGSPMKSTVTLNTDFADTNYTPVAIAQGGDDYSISVESVAVGSFVINLNSAVAPTNDILWTATKHSNP